jgi:hypothetical protein
MIEDLFTELAFRTVDQLLSPATPREDADFGIANINAHLSRPALQKDQGESGPTLSATYQPELEATLLNNYFQLDVDDLEQISPRVHEWMLERVSREFAAEHRESSGQLQKLYFLFPGDTIRHSVVGLLIQVDEESEWQRQPLQKPAISVLSEAIGQDEGIRPEDRVDQLRVLIDFLLDYVDLFPDATGRALTEIYSTNPDETLRTHLTEWSNLLGGTRSTLIRNALDRPTNGRR